MHVTIKYPDGFPLSGYHLALFDWNIRHVFNGRSFSFHSIKKVAKRIGLDNGEERRTALQEELESLDWNVFDEMPPELANALPARVGEFLGVEILQVRSAPVSARRWGARVLLWSALMGVLGLGAFAVESVASVVRSAHNDRMASTAREVATSVPPVPIVISRSATPSVGYVDRDGESRPIVEYSAVTRGSTADAAHLLSVVALQPGQPYRVRFSVEPVASAPAATSGETE